MQAIRTKLTKLISGIIFSGFLFSLYSGALPTYAEEVRTSSVDLIAEIAPTLQVIIPTSISLNLTPNLDGSPVFVSRDLNILVATNNPTGYHLSLQTNSTNLTNNVKDKDGNYPVLETISSELSEEDFTVNRWGYKHNTTNYLPFQTNINLSSTTYPTNRDDIVLTFGAKADITKPAGTYSLALNFHAVTNMIPGVETIIFNPNGGEGTMANQQIEAGTSQMLSTNTFTKAGDWKFIGWNTSSDGAGTNYTENELYTTTLTTENKSLTLYAQWLPNLLISASSMQNVTAQQCEGSYIGAKATLKDLRDSKTYTITKLGNGYCWMTQNLALDLASAPTLYATTSNIDSDTTLTVYNSTELRHYPAVIYTPSTSELQTYTAEQIGIYYNYCAASAGTICTSNTLEDTEYDICPKGWKLPAYNEALGTKNYLTDFVPLNSGVSYGGIYEVGNVGFFWTSTIYSEYNRYSLRYTTSLYAGNNNINNQLSIRCILKI